MVAAEEIPWASLVDRLNSTTSLELKEAGIAFEKGKLKWTDDFESLQHFIKSTLKLEGNWSATGGHLKLFNEESDSIIIRYYTNTTWILFQGDEGKKFMNILAKKITSNQSITIQEDKTKASRAKRMWLDRRKLK